MKAIRSSPSRIKMTVLSVSFSMSLLCHTFSPRHFIMQGLKVFAALFLPFTWALPDYPCKHDSFKVGQIVKSSSGHAIGHAATDHPKVSEYLGIPYAQPPVGDLRFAAPVKYVGSSILNGSAFVGYELMHPHYLQLTCLRVPHALGCHLHHQLLPHPPKLRLQILLMLDSELSIF